MRIRTSLLRLMLFGFEGVKWLLADLFLEVHAFERIGTNLSRLMPFGFVGIKWLLADLFGFA